MAIIRKLSPNRPPQGKAKSEVPEYKTIAEIIKKAGDLGIQTLPFDIETYFKKHSVTIIKEDMSPEISGYIEKRETGWVVGINKYHNLRRQRFTLAHEFAHFLFDKEELANKKRHDDAILFRKDDTSEMEKRANEFAASLLMPATVFDNLLKEGIKSIPDLADRFNVSIAAVRYRAFKLKYISEY